jgi:tagaturonate epimerase
MTRTNRTPDDVLADATWGAFAGGWGGPVGADADHLKTTEDIDRCLAAGYSFYTFDPGAHVDSHADTASAAEVSRKLEALPWLALESSPADLRRRYVGRTVDLAGRALTLSEESILRGAAKYGGAIAHVAALYRHLEATSHQGNQSVPFEVEVSVDETETPTTHAQHVYIASELQRLGVVFVSLAPRYVGRFEKGVDYIGDLAALQADLAGHAAIARALGPYKLSLHSGSDKFSVYPLIVAATDGVVHLKTAGTSYLEALRVFAACEPKLFRDIAALAYERYGADRATYHVSAELSDWVDPLTLNEADLPGLLDNNPVREILHVTFGSALARYRTDIQAALVAHREAYAVGLEQHFIRHLAPFARVAP